MKNMDKVRDFEGTRETYKLSEVEDTECGKKKKIEEIITTFFQN